MQIEETQLKRIKKTEEERKADKKEYQLKNIDKYRERSKKWYLENKVKAKERSKKYHLDNKNKIKEHRKKYRLENKDKIKEYKNKYRLENMYKIKESYKKWSLKNIDELKEYQKKYRSENVDILYKNQSIKYAIKRTEALLALGGLVCVDCGCVDPRCLCIGHIHDNGAEERRNGLTQDKLYKKILRDPESAKLEYEVVCENCNKIKEYNRRIVINPTKTQIRKREQHKNRRVKAMEFLGGVFCKDCGFTDYRALDIEHKNGRGRKEMKEIGGSGIINKIINDSFCLGEYQVLCANCNTIKKVVNDETVRKHNKKEKNERI